MKLKLTVILFFAFLFGLNAQEEPDYSDAFVYLELKEEFDLLVEFSFVNTECAVPEANFYSIIIGIAAVESKLERITVLVPCLMNEFVPGDLISVKPIKTPKENIIYGVTQVEQNGELVNRVFGSEYRAIWGEVTDIL